MAEPPWRKILWRAALRRVRGRSLEVMKRFAKFLKGAMDADFDGGHAAADQAGDFVVAKFLETAEDQKLALFFGELHQGAMQQFRFLLLLRVIGGIHGGRHLRFEGDLRACL